MLIKVVCTFDPPSNKVFFFEVFIMVKETDAVIFFCISCLLLVWKSIQILISIGSSENPILKVLPEKRTPSQLKKMLKSDLVELVIQYQ